MPNDAAVMWLYFPKITKENHSIKYKQFQITLNIEFYKLIFF